MIAAISSTVKPSAVNFASADAFVAVAAFCAAVMFACCVV